MEQRNKQPLFKIRNADSSLKKLDYFVNALVMFFTISIFWLQYSTLDVGIYWPLQREYGKNKNGLRIIYNFVHPIIIINIILSKEAKKKYYLSSFPIIEAKMVACL